MTGLGLIVAAWILAVAIEDLANALRRPTPDTTEKETNDA